MAQTTRRKRETLTRSLLGESPNRVAGRIDLPAPHHLTCGSASGGSGQIAAHNAGWPSQFRFAVSVFWSGVCEFYRSPEVHANVCEGLGDSIIWESHAVAHAVAADLGGVLGRDGDGAAWTRSPPLTRPAALRILFGASQAPQILVDVPADVMHDFAHGCLVSLSGYS